MAGEYWLAMRADGFRGTGTAVDPWDASSPSLINKLMLDIATLNPSGTVCIHIGPGIFQVPARRPLEGFWRPHQGWRIVGAGKYATTLKVVGAAANYPNEMQCAIGNDGWYQYAEGFILEDLTIDCNMRGHKDLACSIGAILLAGSRTKVRRVRVIDFGTETNKECFPVFMAGAHFALPEPRNCEITDCIAEKPSPNNVRETTVLTFGSGEMDDGSAFRGVMSYHRSSVLRRNRVDCDYSVDQRQIHEITFVGTSALARTFQPHNRKVGDWIVVSGALVMDVPFTQGTIINPFNGSFQVSSVPSAYEFSYTMPAVPSAEPTGLMWLGRFPSHLNPITNISQSGTGPWTITLTTATPHFRVPGQNVRAESVKKQDGTDSPISSINGKFVWHKVVDVSSPITLRFVMTTDPESPFVYSNAVIGARFQALGGDGGIAALVERNRVFGARNGGPYHDTWDTKDITVQREYYHSVHTGLQQNMGGVSGPRSADTLSRDVADNKTAILTAPFVHGLRAGQLVSVSNAHINGDPVNPFNGFFLVEKVLTPETLTYRMQADPGADADTADPQKLPNFGAVWQTGRIIYNRNIVELVQNPSPSGNTAGLAAGSGLSQNPLYIFLELIIRRNHVRPADNVFDSRSTGLGANWVEHLIAEENIFSALGPQPIGYIYMGTVRHFNNQTAAGQLVQGVLYPYPPLVPLGFLNQLETELDLALAGTSHH